MSEPTLETQIQASALLRNIFLAVGTLVFPVLLVLLLKFADYPESRAFVVLGAPALGSILAFFAAAVMQFHMRKLARGEPQDSETEENIGERKSGATIGELLVHAVLITGAVMGAFFLFMDVKKSGLAEDIADPASSFLMSEAKPAEVLVEAMHKPVRRAVLIPATEEGPYKGIVCAEAVDGALELYAISKPRGGGEAFNQISMNSDLEAAAPAFCATAFSRLN